MSAVILDMMLVVFVTVLLPAAIAGIVCRVAVGPWGRDRVLVRLRKARQLTLPGFRIRRTRLRGPYWAFALVMSAGLLEWILWWTLWPSDLEYPDLLLNIDGLAFSVFLIGCSIMFSGRPVSAWLGLGGSWRRAVKWALLGALAAYLVTWAFLCSFSVLNPATDMPGRESVLSSSDTSLAGIWIPATTVRLMGLLVSGLVGPIGEELLFRGYIFTALLQRASPRYALLVSSMLFAIYHLDLVYFFGFLGAGLLLGFVRMKGGTKASIGAHALFNASLDILKTFFIP